MRYTINPVYTLPKYFTSKHVHLIVLIYMFSYNIYIYKYEMLVTLRV